MTILVVLKQLQCLQETCGSGDDEVAAFFRVTSTHDDGSTRAAFNGFIVEDCSSGDRPIENARFVGVSPIGQFINSNFTPGIELLSPAADRRPVTRVDVETIGLEIDGSDSTLQQANDHMADFRSTGRIDPTIGVNDDVLWSLRWGMAVEANDDLRLFGVDSAAVDVDDGELTGLVSGPEFLSQLDPPLHIVVADSRNHAQESRYELTFAFAALPI